MDDSTLAGDSTSVDDSTQEPRASAAPAAGPAPKCPYCRSTWVHAEAAQCPACSTVGHADCWTENGGCAVLGCSQGPRDTPTTLQPSTAAATPGAYGVTHAQAAPAATPSTPAAAVPAAGWYDDPSEPGGLRWWDGVQWTEHTSRPAPLPGPMAVGGVPIVVTQAGAESDAAFVAGALEYTVGELSQSQLNEVTRALTRQGVRWLLSDGLLLVSPQDEARVDVVLTVATGERPTHAPTGQP